MGCGCWNWNYVTGPASSITRWNWAARCWPWATPGRGGEVLAQAARTVATARDLLALGSPLLLLLEYVLMTPHLPPGFPMTRHLAANLARQYFPASPPLLWGRAQWAAAQGEHALAASLWEKVLELGHSGAYDRWVSFEPSIFGPVTYYRLSEAYARAGRVAQARQCLKPLIESPQHRDEARSFLARLGEWGPG